MKKKADDQSLIGLLFRCNEHVRLIFKRV